MVMLMMMMVMMQIMVMTIITNVKLCSLTNQLADSFERKLNEVRTRRPLLIMLISSILIIVLLDGAAETIFVSHGAIGISAGPYGAQKPLE